MSRFLGFPPGPAPTRDLTGDRNHFSPEWQLSLVAEWSDRIPVHGLGWFVRGEYQYISDQNVGGDTNQAPQTMQPGYDIVNARLGLRGANDDWEFSGFVHNVFGQDYCQVIFIQPLATHAEPGRPGRRRRHATVRSRCAARLGRGSILPFLSPGNFSRDLKFRRAVTIFPLFRSIKG